ncbi:MAG: hypothetical protein KatS3mg110_3793 [Pirellulaceae bacterium]|nr:MAG: hypothetical protein KatS3mg110_3793 [Pirellulaceae bacterium]
MGRAGCRTAALFWCVCFSVVSLARQVCVYAQSRDSTIREVDALAAATDTWLTSIEFYCRFEQYSGTAASWDDALAEKYTKPLQLRCTGEYAVSKDCIRHAVRDPNAPSPSGSRNAATTSAPQKTSGGLKIHDAARNKKSRVRLIWQPGKAQFLPWMPDQRSELALPDEALVADDYVTMFLAAPTFVWGWARFSNLLSHYRNRERRGQTVRWEVIRPNPETWEVHIGDRDELSRTVALYQLVGQFPMLTKLETLRRQDPNASWERSSIAFYEKPVLVTGGPIASQVRSMYVTLEGISVRLWRATDFRAPRSQDFIVRVPADDRIYCVQRSSIPSAAGGYRPFDIARMSTADLSWECRVPGIAGIPEAESASNYGWLWLLGVAALATLLLCAVYRWRKKGLRWRTS